MTNNYRLFTLEDGQNDEIPSSQSGPSPNRRAGVKWFQCIWFVVFLLLSLVVAVRLTEVSC